MDLLRHRGRLPLPPPQPKRVQALARAGRLPGRRVGRQVAVRPAGSRSAAGPEGEPSAGRARHQRPQPAARHHRVADDRRSHGRGAAADRRPGAHLHHHPRRRPSGCGSRSATRSIAVIKSTEVMIGKGSDPRMRISLPCLLHRSSLCPPQISAQAQTRAPEPELTVFAAASLTGAFQEIGAMFERAHPGTRVQLQLRRLAAARRCSSSRARSRMSSPPRTSAGWTTRPRRTCSR